MTETIEATAVNTVDLENPQQFAAATVPPAQELQRIPQQHVQSQATDPVMGMLQTLVERGGDLEQMNRLLDLRDRLAAGEALRQFNSDFAAFKAESIQIIKNQTIKDGPLKGKSYADLHAVVSSVTSALSKHNLSASWKLTKDEPGWIEVTCFLRHTGGHAETVYMGAPPDSGGAKNGIQARASTVSYLERYTFLAVAGLSASDQPDVDDGASTGGEERKLLQHLIGLAQSTTTDAAALDVWKRHNGELTAWPWAHGEFKKAVAAHRNGMKATAS